MWRTRIVAGAIIATVSLGVTTLAVRAGDERNDAEQMLLEESKARATAEAKVVSLEALQPELSAAKVRADELQASLSDKEAEIAKLDQRDVVVVVGKGQVLGTPDVLNFHVGVSVQRATVREAMNAANEAAAKVIAALKRHGVQPKDIQTAWISVYPDYDYSGGRSTLIGYVAGNTVQAKIRDVPGAGKVIASAAEAGGNDARISGISFDLEENTTLLKAAREAAMGAAKVKAEDYARLAGRKLGRVLYLSETTSSPPPPISHIAGRSSAAFEYAESFTPIEPGQKTAGVTVTVVFLLE